MPLENLALSPQCGFASTMEGNLLTEDEQWSKLELVAKTARQVWGELKKGTACLLILFSCALKARAQDPFEIHVYEYEPLSWNQYSLEAHLNFDTQGTAQRGRDAASHAAPDAFNAGANHRRFAGIRRWGSCF